MNLREMNRRDWFRNSAFVGAGLALPYSAAPGANENLPGAERRIQQAAAACLYFVLEGTSIGNSFRPASFSRHSARRY